MNFSDLSALVYRFFSALDRRDHRAVAQLMAGDGTWLRQGVTLTGPNEVFTALEKRDTKRTTCHVITNLWVESSDEHSACVHYYLSAYESIAADDGTSSPIRLVAIRDCIDELVRDGGHWRIKSKNSVRHLPPESH